MRENPGLAGLGNYLDPRSPLWSLPSKQYVALRWSSLSLSEIGELDGPEFEKPINRLHDLVIFTEWRFLAGAGDLHGGCHVGSIKPGTPPMPCGLRLMVVTQRRRLGSLTPRLAAISKEA